MPKVNHSVKFVGAGPGDPELITVKGQKALNEADLIIYAGSLVPEALLKWKKDSAKAVNSASMNLDEIATMIQKAHKENQKIVRLHTGDPSLYGAIFEQMRELDKHDIEYEVIPGVTAAFAAAAAMGMEYTLPEVTQTLILTRISGRTPVPDQESLELLASHQSSMAIYLSIAHVDRVQQILALHYGEQSICAVAYKVSHPEERIVFTKIKNLSATVKSENLNRQALIIVGKAVETASLKKAVIKSKLYDAGFSHGFREQTCDCSSGSNAVNAESSGCS
ncbi:MAG: precorrin-4 C(11)-methyltransferase [Desulfamplus sp.]|nr:precorrin-4 C(11)-methyltransferase [Desulfamplus sp.]